MTVILRLQGLDVKAGTEDIRTFFESLHIPDGGVYIVGGSLREAFIAFTTEKDAQLAMRHTGSFLKGSKVTLHISSMAELEHKLKSLLKRKKASPMQVTVERPEPSPDASVLPLNATPHNSNTADLPPTTAWTPDPNNTANLPPTTAWTLDPNNTADLPPTTAWTLDPNNTANLPPTTAWTPDPNNTANLPPTTAWTPDPNNTANLPLPLCPSTSNVPISNVHSLDSNTAFILGICTVLQGLQSSRQRENSLVDPRLRLPKADSAVVSDEVRTPEQTLNSKPGYVRLFGLPASTTKEDICRFFQGLTVQEAIVNVKLGHGHGCLVKFANTQDACDALLFNQQMLGSISVEVRGATEKMWTGALQECESALDVGKKVKPKQSPLRETANHKQKSTSALWIKRRSVNRLPSKSPKKPRPNGDSTPASSPTVEYTVRVSNLPKEMTKTEIKELFGCPNLAHKNVLHLLDKESNRTDTAFLIFTHAEDYDYAINLTGCHVGSDAIEVSPITRIMMRKMIAETHPRSLARCLTVDAKKKPNRKRKSDPVDTPEEAPSLNLDPAARPFLFVRNMPADVRKNQIYIFFRKYKLKKDDIILLLDSEGKATGEAVVQFKSQKLAALAQRLHGQDFLGAKVLLTRINVKQKEDILAKNV